VVHELWHVKGRQDDKRRIGQANLVVDALAKPLLNSLPVKQVQHK